jgi:tetratricopeptide (TPR) repeat protein
LPGELWSNSIQIAIEESDFFLACISNHSIDKRGILQKEVKTALDDWEGMLEGDIYLIPVRLEDCSVPNRLDDFQWVDLFKEDGWFQLENAIRKGMDRRTKKTGDADVSVEKLPERVRPPLPIPQKTQTHPASRRGATVQPGNISVVALFLAPWVYNNYFFRAAWPDDLPAAYCQPAPGPIYVGVAELQQCSPDFRTDLVDGWKNEKVNLYLLPESFSTSPDARRVNGRYDIVVWGACNVLEGDTADLQYELITSQKPFEIYEPPSLATSGTIEVLSRFGWILFDYWLGDFSEAHRQLSSLSATWTSADLMLLRANSSLLDLESVTAINEFKEITRRFPDGAAAAYNNMGVAVSQDLDRAGEALGLFNQSVSLAVDNPQIGVEALARINRSLLYLSESKWEEAHDDCDEARLLNAKSALPYLCLARYNFRYFRTEEPGWPLPLIEIDRNLNDAETRPDAPPLMYYLRADWHLSHFWQQKQAAAEAYGRYLKEMEYRSCLPTDYNRNGNARIFLDELTGSQK